MVIRRKVDDRLATLLESGINDYSRSIIVLIGKDTNLQVQNIHLMRSRYGGLKPTVCWCYKKELGFTANKMKKLKQIQKKRKRGNFDAEVDDPFWLFQQGTKVRYCKYRDSERLLGQTFDMLVLQDIAALTPNILCQTVETVRGGGIIILCFKSIETFDDLFTMRFDIHKAYADLDNAIKPRFCKRFIRSLTECSNCLVLDENLQLLPISYRRLAELDQRASELPEAIRIHEGGLCDSELKELIATYQSNVKLQSILKLCYTKDQARILSLVNKVVASDGIFTVTAGRGRGKSAGVGLLLGLLAYTSSARLHIILSAPVIENVSTVYEFMLSALEALGMVDSLDFVKELWQEEIGEETDSYRRRLVRRIRFLTKDCRVEYYAPHELIGPSFNSEVDLLVIDEAGAVPMECSQAILERFHAPTLVSTTIDGYEGSGSLLVRQFLKNLAHGGRPVYSIELDQPIRYRAGDPVEAWLSKLLLLQTHRFKPETPTRESVLHLKDSFKVCRVDRDRLFEFSAESEKLLKEIVSVLTCSTAIISADDILYMSDPRYKDILVIRNDKGAIIAAAEIALQGATSSKKDEVRGHNVPWILSYYYPSSNIEKLRCIRVERVACVPGYECIMQPFLNVITTHYDGSALSQLSVVDENSKISIDAESIDPAKSSAEFMTDLSLLSPSFNGHYVAAIVPLTESDANKWNKFIPVYVSPELHPICRTYNAIFIHEYTQISPDKHWSLRFSNKFLKRFLAWLPHGSSSVSSSVAMKVISECNSLRDEFMTHEEYQYSRDSLKSVIPNLDALLTALQESRDLINWSHLIRRLAYFYFLGHCSHVPVGDVADKKLLEYVYYDASPVPDFSILVSRTFLLTSDEGGCRKRRRTSSDGIR